MQNQDILKHALMGDSVIDWSHLFFNTPEEVRQFLKVNEFDLSRQKDLDRLSGIHNETIGYLTNQLHFDLNLDLQDSQKMIDLFLIATNTKDKKLQKQACAILKTMNIINHIDGRELLYNCPISLRDIFSLVEDKVERSLSSLSLKEPGLLRYEGGRKPKESLITKLLSKRETIAAQINDRVRYRIVTRGKEDIPKIILHLFNTILPFNYLIPGASANQIISLAKNNKGSVIHRGLKTYPHKKDYTSKHYKISKFVVDIPIRLDNFLAQSGGPAYRESLGTIAYAMVEFQMVDEATARMNNSGDSSHDHYKIRQKAGVVKRLIGR